MTRDSIPRDDLYGELEVSRQASVAAIEAAYRRLVKQHHPDVARSDDVERIKRLNLAREWLTDLDRRRRYDVSRGMSPTSAISHHSPSGDDARSGARSRPGAPSGPATDSSSEPVRSFGVNANEVRIFLASLRGLDSDRARRVFDGRAVAHAKGYAEARRAATHIGQTKRKTEWQLAREAASVIARGKLGDTKLTEQVVDVLADIAGAIAIRDLLSKADYKTVLLPWTWRSARVVPDKAALPKAQATKPAPSTAATSTGPPTPTTAAAPTTPTAARAATAVAVASAAAVARPPVVGPPAAAAGIAVRPAPRVSISDLGASPWQAPPEPEPEPEPPSAIAPSSLARAVPALSLSARPAAGRPVPARPGPERHVRGAASPAVAIPGSSRPSVNPPRVRAPSWVPAAIAIAVFVVVAGALLGIGRPPAEQQVAGITDAPTSATNGATAVVIGPGGSIAGPSAEPGVTEPTGEPGRTAGSGGATEPPEPTEPAKTPKPTRPPTPAPTPPPPTPAPTPPPPTPTPEGQCTVPNLIGERASTAAATWSADGFTGSVTFDPPMQPNQRIGFQSLTPGSSEPCSSGITVSKVT